MRRSPAGARVGHNHGKSPNRAEVRGGQRDGQLTAVDKRRCMRSAVERDRGRSNEPTAINRERQRAAADRRRRGRQARDNWLRIADLNGKGEGS